MSDDYAMRPGIHRPLKSDAVRAGAFISAASSYSQLGIDCFNLCIDPGQEISADTIRGMEKRCMDGCLSVNL